MSRKIGFVLVLALAFLASAGSQAASAGKKTPASPTTSTVKPAPAVLPTTLPAARQALAKKASGTESFATAIESYALALSPRDAVALITEFAPKAAESRRRGL